MNGQELLVHKINQLLVDSQVANPRFSLRALAKKLDLPVSTLSELRSGKRPISPKLAFKIAQYVTLTTSERETIDDFVNHQANRKDLVRLKNRAYTQLSSDQFSVIGDWVPFAILSLIKTKGFVNKPSWIAKRLGVSEAKVEQALNSLLRLELIRATSKGGLERTKKNLTTTDDVASLAIRKAHIQNLELAQNAIQTVSVEDRDFTSITMAIKKSRLKEAKEIVRAFRDQLADFLTAKDADEVYRLSIQLFPMTVQENEK